ERKQGGERAHGVRLDKWRRVHPSAARGKVGRAGPGGTSRGLDGITRPGVWWVRQRRYRASRRRPGGWYRATPPALAGPGCGAESISIAARKALGAPAGWLGHAGAPIAVPPAPRDLRSPVRMMSMLSSKIQAGNSRSTQGVRPTLTSRTAATARPAIPIHRGMTFVRSVRAAVLIGKTAAIRNAYTCSTSGVSWRLVASVSGRGPADPAATAPISPPATAAP